MRQAASSIEDSVRRLEFLFGHGYGSNIDRLIDALDRHAEALLATTEKNAEESDASEPQAGDHYWAIFQDSLVVVSFDGNDFAVCGPWEGSIAAKDLTLLAKIPRPVGHETSPLYFYSH